MDEEIEKRNEDNILHSGLRAWLKKINLLDREVFREWVR